jgi:hypothetical protein
MLIELRDNIFAVLNSSLDIQKIFIPIIQHLVDETSTQFNFEEIHREELAKSIEKDEFLKVIFNQIATNQNISSYEELFEIYSEIKENLKITNHEMTRFRKFIDIVLEKLNLNTTTSNANTPIKTSKECTHFNLIHSSINNCTCSCNHGDMLTKNIPNNTIKKDKFKDIDDLIDYINKEEEEEVKPKKNKKKNNKKDKKQNQANPNNIPIDKEKLEKEIEEFKLNIKNDSINAYNIRKIKPNLSREWVNNLGAEFIN